jgi:hypothetical protein
VTGSKTGTTIPGVLVGNKCEYRDGTIDTRAEVVREEAERHAAEMGLAYFETSAVRFQICERYSDVTDTINFFNRLIISVWTTH